MKPFLKFTFKLTLAVVILSGAAFFMSKSIDIQGVSTEQLSAAKPFFGADEYAYEAPKGDTAESALSSKINWAIIGFTALMVLVLANAFDISKYTSKITGRETVNQNNVNKWTMLIFMVVGLAAAIWEFGAHGKHILLNNSASEHGIDYDSMFTITLIVTSIVFFATQFLLFWFSFKYAHKDGQKALYLAHNNRLEVFWTIIPAIVLTLLVLRGHQTWRSVVYAEENNKGKIHSIEVFAYQFGWKARYAGEDGIMGIADYKFISGKNELGLAFKPEVDSLIVELRAQIEAEKLVINDIKSGAALAALKTSYTEVENLRDYKNMESLQKEIDALNNGEKMDEAEASIKRKTKQIDRILAIQNNSKQFASTFNGAANDDIVTQEIHIAKDSLVTFNFRSKDIIHSAWLPHMRAQMNVVPGMPTKFTFRPTKSTLEAKKEFGETFEYYLYCNKICGVSHYNMKIKVVVETQAEVNAWLATQQPAFIKKPVVAPAVINSSDSTMQADTTKKLAIN
jgi:cytochrome c oxidase subunit 2